MEFIFDTEYDQKGLTAMARALRKTVRKKKSRRSHIYSILIICAGIMLSLPGENEIFEITSSFVFTWIAIIIMVLVLIFEDRLNGYIAKKRMLPGMNKTLVTFGEESYISETAVGKSEFYYANIDTVAETEEYIILIFSKMHAQIYNKNGITKGTTEEFKQFITQKTGKEIQRIK